MKTATVTSFDSHRRTEKPAKEAPAKAAAPSGGQAEMFAVPMADGPQTKPGRAFTGMTTFDPAPGARMFLAAAPKSSSHFPVMEVRSAMAYANERAEHVRALIDGHFGRGELVVLPAKGGDWVSFIRAAIFQGLTDGYAALEGGIPVAIPDDAKAIPEEVLNGKAK